MWLNDGLKMIPCQVLVEGLKIALALAQTQPFKAVGTKLWDKVLMPGRYQHAFSFPPLPPAILKVFLY
jgi:hypothetical protein